MPRRARPWLRKGRSMETFHGTVGGRVTNLGVPGPDTPDSRAAAEAVYARLIREAAERAAAETARQLRPPAAAPPPEGPTVAAAVAGFLAAADRKAAAGRLKAKTVAGYRGALGPFAAALGPRPLGSLAAEEVEDWADRPAWSNSTRNTYLGAVQTLLKWARVVLPIRRPPKESRGAETCLTDDQFALVLAHAVRGKYPGDLRELLRTLRETGARPGEAARLEVDGVDWPNACTRLREHKTRRHTGADRVIHFNAAAMAILAAQRDRYGTGLLFRTRAGGAYGEGAIARRCLAISGRVGFRVIAYGLGRHSFATAALTNGVPDVLVAGLLGHTGTGMLHRHYSHVGEQARALKDAAERARPKAG